MRCRVKFFFKFRVSVFLMTFIWQWMFANLYLLILCARLLMSHLPLLHLPPSPSIISWPLSPDLLYLPISSYYSLPGLLSAASLVFICDIFFPVFGSNLTSRSGLLCFFLCRAWAPIPALPFCVTAPHTVCEEDCTNISDDEDILRCRYRPSPHPWGYFKKEHFFFPCMF